MTRHSCKCDSEIERGVAVKCQMAVDEEDDVDDDDVELGDFRGAHLKA